MNKIQVNNEKWLQIKNCHSIYLKTFIYSIMKNIQLLQNGAKIRSFF